ncbi:MAG TPA: galactokinase [Fimbriimonas sp.]
MSEARVRSLFKKTFGKEPLYVGIAPGRVNLIGEHTDYSDGFVFPAAIDRGLYIAASPASNETQLVSNELGEGERFDVRKVAPGSVDGWARYAAAMAWAMRKAGHDVPNINAVIVSDIPIGSGVSSSAAIEMAFGIIWRELVGAEIDGTALAKIGQVSENQFVGVQSGIMDQMASANGKAGHAMFLDTRSLEIRYAPIPKRVSVVLCDTQKRRELSDGSYNERRSECEEAAEVLGVKKLRDADMQMLEAAKGELSDVVYRRARHVITENARCLAFAEALDQSDLDEVGALMRQSHESLRDDFEVSVKELDAMAEAAWSAPGCIGARMTGAGFGGACVALVRTREVDAFSASTLARYSADTRFTGELMTCQVVDGARLIL